MEEILFQNPGITLTPKLLKAHGQTIQVANISSVDAEAELFPLKAFIGYTIGVLIGLSLIFTFDIGSLLAGLVIVGFCGFFLYNMFKPKFVFTIALSSGQSIKLNVYSREELNIFKNALDQAMSAKP